MMEQQLTSGRYLECALVNWYSTILLPLQISKLEETAVLPWKLVPRRSRVVVDGDGNRRSL
jgi:hypothetical protein